ncbi:Protein CBG26345 [Caenorhabditis briggsae]|uniref:Protein CBG26345 n=1 Tax=Caenorhabditis briggsae TaxID=6238 RepID=B6IGB6_CAEBR|nr:Protein CBG26345 [Caenorhabditis briggsae]CAR98946.1 Protein CBG26345 [Caenorhabditis briggsae]
MNFLNAKNMCSKNERETDETTEKTRKKGVMTTLFERPLCFQKMDMVSGVCVSKLIRKENRRSENGRRTRRRRKSERRQKVINDSNLAYSRRIQRKMEKNPEEKEDKKKIRNS